MERYKVHWGKGDEDFSIIYADNEAEAADMFQKYQPDKTVLEINAFPNLPSLLTLYKQGNFANEHEYLLAVIEAVQDAGVEDKVIQFLIAKGWRK